MKPAFKRPNWWLKRVGPAWRKPKGLQSKLRQHQKSHGFLPNPGYGLPRAVRGLHPSGFTEVQVSNVSQLMGLKPDVHAVRISATVGNLKRNAIQEAANAAGLRVLNPKKITIRMKKEQKKEVG